MKILVLYPHGLGDCILATPALRERKIKTGDFIGIAIRERFRSSNFFFGCPWVDEVFYTKQPWQDYPSYEIGCRDIIEKFKVIGKENGYDEVIFVDHSGHKILSVAKTLEVDVFRNCHTEVYITEEQEEKARFLIGSLKFGFVHTNTGVSAKDLPEEYGAKWIAKRLGIEHIVEVGKTFKYDEFDIGTQFAIMNLASGLCLPDSVFFHAACALDKKIDLSYFYKGSSVYDRVKPLHDSEHNLTYSLESV